MGLGVEDRIRMAKRAAKEIAPGMCVNLGIGIPTLVANYIPDDWNVMFHAENGIVGAGPKPVPGQEDENLCNAGGYPITLRSGGVYFDSATAFAIVRKQLLDMTILGGLEVSEQGDLANWIVPGKRVPGMGGAMDLAVKNKKLVVLMSHTDKKGNPKIVTECKLPLTAARCVHLIITEMAVIEVNEGGLTLKETMGNFSLDEIKASTGCQLTIPPDFGNFH
ncbi:3-oxoacid CoA-transferase subunit B [Alkalihalobacterium elongatum]|uniref:3-oxoacid CoA-transferase subunit B n=1 Tax=Alkalihalobacterium elongatum TaxID=2675466 RepID=UPI001C1FEB3A|nr:3-oxoacid CoA-transferase subunit B [Alkalihalobacterium elongatum]